MNILVVGQSHIAAIRDAARARREADPDRPRTRVIHTAEARYDGELAGDAFTPSLSDALADQIARHRPLVASAMGGNYHNVLSLLRHPRPWDFRLSGEDEEPDPSAEPIPEALVHAALQAGLGRDMLRLRLLRDAAGPFVHLESPPPVRDDGWVAARADRYFADRSEGPLQVAPAPLRRRVWRLNSRIFRQQVEALGCRFLPVPPETQDAGGYLRQDFAADATHGDGRYGEAVIAALERLDA